MDKQYQALVVRKIEKKQFIRAVETCDIKNLPKADVLIRVLYSSINYKDGLVCIGNPGVTRRYPHTPGIDAAGIVVSCQNKDYKKGDQVIVVSQDLGITVPGGFGQYVSVPSTWITPLPKNISLRESMIYGTAGFTAGLAISKLINNGITPSDGPILITGSTGGIGIISIAILSKLGFHVYAVTRKMQNNKYLLSIGAEKILVNSDIIDELDRHLIKEKWAAVIDTVGGIILSNVLKACKYNGIVIATGNVSSQHFTSSILPFILRGVSLLGINSQGALTPIRQLIWDKLSNNWKPNSLNKIATECDLFTLNQEIDKVIQGDQTGRIIVKLN